MLKNDKLLVGVNHELADIIREAAKAFERFSGYTVGVTSGFRTAEEQLELFRLGKSKTTRSQHMFGNAVDIAIFKGKEAIWRLDWYREFNRFVQREAREREAIVGWGGNWRHFKDGPHFWIATDDNQVASVALMITQTEVRPSPAKDGGDG